MTNPPKENQSVITDQPLKNPIKKPRRLSLRQERFAQEYIKNNGDATKAAEIVYARPKNNSNRAIASENLTKPAIVNRISQILNDKGLDLDSLSLDLRDKKNNACRPVVVGKQIIDYPDEALRLEAIKTAFKLHGVLDRKQEDSIKTQVNISMDSNDLPKMSELIDRLDSLSNKMGFLIEDGECV